VLRLPSCATPAHHLEQFMYEGTCCRLQEDPTKWQRERQWLSTFAFCGHPRVLAMITQQRYFQDHKILLQQNTYHLHHASRAQERTLQWILQTLPSILHRRLGQTMWKQHASSIAEFVRRSTCRTLGKHGIAECPMGNHMQGS